MNRSSSRGHASAFLALACVGAFAVPQAHAAEDPVPGTVATDPTTDPKAAAAEQDRDQITVTGQQYEARQASPKATRPVLDTPQTVTIITAETIEQQNLLTLRDVLSTVPGITFGAGEGGGGYGDSINLRGYSANTDITVDGVRDSAQYTRSDPFNLEQIEVVNGANSVLSGAGSVGGTINIVTKRPTGRDAYVFVGGVGTDNYYRGTVDLNKRVSDLVAVRLNAMYHENDVPGRDVENYERWGVAPSVTIGIDGPTSLTVQYLHQEDTNIPQYGVPYYKTATNDGPLPGVDPSDYFGYRNVDTQEINVDALTVTFNHDFSETLSIRNLARWQDVTQLAIVNPPQGTWCLADNLTPTGAACTATIATQVIGSISVPGGTLSIPPGYYLPSGPRGTARDSRNQLLYDQVDLSAVFDTGGLEHTLVLGASAAWEKYNLSSGNVLRNANGTAAFPYLPLMYFANPNDVVPGPAAPGGLARVYGNNVYTGPINYIETARQTGEQTNFAVYLFDTIKFSEQFEFNGGIRYERNEGSFRPDTVAATGAAQGTVTTGTRVYNDDNLLSYRAGLVYKPAPWATFYAAYGNSKTPSKTSVNGSCTIAGVNGATATTCNVDPETAVNYEIGAKGEFAGGRLLLTAALFRNERTNYKVPSNDPTIPDQQLDGKSRVDGIALGAVGQITSRWSINANYTYLDSEVISNVASNGTTVPTDPQAGNPLTQVPEHSGSLFTTYKFPFGLQVGYGFTYQGSFYLNNGAGPLFKSDDYLIHSAYVAYEFNRNISAQLNVKNFTDEEYYTRIRNNGWATVGDRAAAIFSVNVRY